MGRKVFISFLGTSPYLSCNYVLGDKRVEGVRYIQEALLRLYAMDWREGDEVMVFLTAEARSRNWLDNPRAESPLEVAGLGTRLEWMKQEGFKPTIKAVDIHDAGTEKEIWDIFTTVYQQLQVGDEIYFDVTHAFRSIPMFAIVLFNYAKFLKGTSLKAIHYGAFEKLGCIADVKKMAVEQRDAPVVDLTAFVSLQEWTSAADRFINYGDASEISRLATGQLAPINRETQGKDINAKSISTLGKYLSLHVQDIRTCRSMQLMKGDNARIVGGAIESIEDTLIKPFDPIFSIIKDEIKPFLVQEKIGKLFASVAWCIEKDHVQQGITLLNELVVTIICDVCGLDLDDIEKRTVVSSLLNVVAQGIGESEWKSILTENMALVHEIQSKKVFGGLCQVYANISGVRNDLNHAGMSDKYSDAAFFSKKLRSFHDQVREIYVSGSKQ